MFDGSEMDLRPLFHLLFEKHINNPGIFSLHAAIVVRLLARAYVAFETGKGAGADKEWQRRRVAMLDDELSKLTSFDRTALRFGDKCQGCKLSLAAYTNLLKQSKTLIARHLGARIWAFGAVGFIVELLISHNLRFYDTT